MKLSEQLKQQFPWLNTDDPTSGADVVDQLSEWYHGLLEEEAERLERRKAAAEADEYQVHILNWAVSASSPKEAAQFAALSMADDPTGFVFTVTDREATPSAEWGDFDIREDFDSALFCECADCEDDPDND